MKKDTSCYGTTCRFCGHPAATEQAIPVKGVRYRCCELCKRAARKGDTLEEVIDCLKRARNQDLNELEHAMLTGAAKSAVYWAPVEFRALLTQCRQYGKIITQALRPKEYHDEFAAATQERIAGAVRDYNKAKRKEKKDE